MIRVLVVRSEHYQAQAFCAALRQNGLGVCAAVDPSEIEAAVADLRPDLLVVLLGLGIENSVVGSILERHAIPLVACCSPDLAGAAIAEGALWSTSVPSTPDEFAAFSKRLKVLAGVVMVRRRPRGTADNPTGADQVSRLSLVVVGASTGGPESLRQMLVAMPADFPLPVVVVQHISEGFLAPLVEWLDKLVPISCRIGHDGELLRPGQVVFAAEGSHWGVADGRLRRLDGPPENGLRPSVARLFASVLGQSQSIAAVLLSGMGTDGAQEMKRLREQGALTFVEDEASCAVFGMPGEAVRLGASAMVLKPPGIGRRLVLAAAGKVEAE